MDLSYIKIADPGIIAIITGGSLRTSGWDSKLILNASESRDIASSSSDLKSFVFKWYCRQEESRIGNGGCFGNGEGLVEFDEPVYEIRKRMLYERINYVFTVNVTSLRDTSRYKMASQTVIIIAGDPPNINIRYVFLVFNLF